MKQRGQTLVEFALLLPLFFLFLFGTMYVGFLFSDYMSYDNMARMAAREAAITGPVNSSYKGLEQQYGTMIENAHMTTNLYEFSTITIRSTQGMSGNSVPSDGVQVEINTKLNNQYAFVHLLEGIGIDVPKGYTIRYYMYNEKKTDNSGT